MIRILRLTVALALSVGLGGHFSPALAQAQAGRVDPIECPEGEADLVIAAGTVGNELRLLNTILDEYRAACPNVRINALESPSITSERLAIYLQLLGAESSAVDIYQIDVIWPNLLAEHMIDLYEYIPRDSPLITRHFERIVANNTVDGRLIGMPWFTDAGLLYYRTDLLEKYELDVPQTWGQLEEAARIIQEGEREAGNTDFWGFVWQGNIGEPVMINALEWQASNGGGVIINSEGVVQVYNPQAITAFERAADWLGTITPFEVLTHGAGDTTRIWVSGNAAFMRNWPSAYNASNAPTSRVAGNFNVTQLPSGETGTSAAVLGGWQLAVSRYSQYPEAAVSVVKFLTSYDVQRERAINNNYNPTIASLYEDEEVLNASPLFNRLLPTFLTATPRPSTVTGEYYTEVVSLYSRAVTAILLRRLDARTALEDLEYDLKNLMSRVRASS